MGHSEHNEEHDEEHGYEDSEPAAH